MKPSANLPPSTFGPLSNDPKHGMGDEDNGGGGGGDGDVVLRSSSNSKVRRRHRSTTVAEEIVTEELKQRRAQPDRPYESLCKIMSNVLKPVRLHLL